MELGYFWTSSDSIRIQFSIQPFRLDWKNHEGDRPIPIGNKSRNNTSVHQPPINGAIHLDSH